MKYFYSNKLPQTKASKGSTGRTIHYRTADIVSKSEFELLQESVKKLNSERTWSLEGIKLWRGRGLAEEGRAWGFTKIKTEEEAKLVLDSLKKLSSKMPKLTWKVFDEGKTKSKKFHLKKGELLPD